METKKPEISLIYLSTHNCSVCHVLKPKLKASISRKYPNIGWIEVMADEEAEYAAQHRVFSVPSVLILIEGKEYQRFVRAFSVAEVLEAIERPYRMIYEE